MSLAPAGPLDSGNLSEICGLPQTKSTRGIRVTKGACIFYRTETKRTSLIFCSTPLSSGVTRWPNGGSLCKRTINLSSILITKQKKSVQNNVDLEKGKENTMCSFMHVMAKSYF